MDDFDRDDAICPVNRRPDGQVSDSFLRRRIKKNGALNAAKREEIEIGIGAVGTSKRDSWASAEIARWHAVGSKFAVDPCHQHILLVAHTVGDVEGEGQMPAFVIAEALAVEPDFRQIVDRVETHENALSAPAPRQREGCLIPGRTQIITPFVELIVPTGWNGDDLAAVEACSKAAAFVGIKLDAPEAGQVDHLALGVGLWIEHVIVPLLCYRRAMVECDRLNYTPPLVFSCATERSKVAFYTRRTNYSACSTSRGASGVRRYRLRGKGVRGNRHDALLRYGRDSEVALKNFEGSTISLYETGKRRLYAIDLPSFAGVLQVPVSYFLRPIPCHNRRPYLMSSVRYLRQVKNMH